MTSRELFIAIHIPIAALLAAASGFQFFGLGSDYVSYLEFYSGLQVVDPSSFYRFEPGFVTAAYFSKFILRLDYPGFVTIFIFASLLIKIFVFSRIPKSFYALLFYLLNWYLLHDYTQIRASMAVSLIFVSFLYLSKDKLLYFAAFVFFASLFHGTALLAGAALFFAWFVRDRSLFTAVFFTVVGAAAVPYILLNLLPREFLLTFNSEVNFYLESFNEGRPNLLSITNILTVVLLSSMVWSGATSDKSTRIIALVTIAGLCLAVGFVDITAFSLRLKEVLVVLLPLAAVNPRLTRRTAPQRGIAIMLALWQLLANIRGGLI